MSIVNVTKTQMIDLCVDAAKNLKLPVDSTLDPIQLLWALSGNETSFGSSISPHHEAAYCPFTNGVYYKNSLEIKNQTASIGCMAHMSYGPLQILYPNIEKFYGPTSVSVLLLNMQAMMGAAVAFLNKEILGRQGCKTLDEIGDAYNSGNARDLIVPKEYIEKLKKNYNVPMHV